MKFTNRLIASLLMLALCFGLAIYAGLNNFTSNSPPETAVKVLKNQTDAVVRVAAESVEIAPDIVAIGRRDKFITAKTTHQPITDYENFPRNPPDFVMRS